MNDWRLDRERIFKLVRQLRLSAARSWRARHNWRSEFGEGMEKGFWLAHSAASDWIMESAGLEWKDYREWMKGQK